MMKCGFIEAMVGGFDVNLLRFDSGKGVMVRSDVG